MNFKISLLGTKVSSAVHWSLVLMYSLEEL